MVLTLGPTGTRYGAKLRIEWDGLEKVRANLKKIAERYPIEMGSVLREECIQIMDKSLSICPFDQDNNHKDGTPHLNETAQVEGPYYVKDKIYCVMSYDTPYAVLQHEVQEYHHDEPEQWKYLEHPMNERAPFMAVNLARGVNMERVLQGYTALPIAQLRENLAQLNAGRLRGVKQRQAIRKYGHLLGRFV